MALHGRSRDVQEEMASEKQEHKSYRFKFILLFLILILRKAKSSLMFYKKNIIAYFRGIF